MHLYSKKRTGRTRAEQNGCNVLPDRTNCHDCIYSSDPDLFDGCCLYGKDNSDTAKQKGE